MQTTVHLNITKHNTNILSTSKIDELFCNPNQAQKGEVDKDASRLSTLKQMDLSSSHLISISFPSYKICMQYISAGSSELSFR